MADEVLTLPTPPGQNLILSQKARACMTSPDEWDAMALTFTEPVADVSNFHRRLEYRSFGVA